MFFGGEILFFIGAYVSCEAYQGTSCAGRVLLIVFICRARMFCASETLFLVLCTVGWDYVLTF